MHLSTHACRLGPLTAHDHTICDRASGRLPERGETQSQLSASGEIGSDAGPVSTMRSLTTGGERDLERPAFKDSSLSCYLTVRVFRYRQNNWGSVKNGEGADCMKWLSNFSRWCLSIGA
jgi:hypothetical protein